MRVAVMDVGEVFVRMRQRLVNVTVRVRRGRVNIGGVRVLVMLVVSVAMRVFEPLVLMGVGVPLRQMKPDAHAHQCSGDPEGAGNRLAQKQ